MCRPPILEAHDTLINYWRLNRILYPRPLFRDERAEKQRKLEEERHLERQVQDRAREAQLEAMRALVGDLPCNMTIRKGALERSSDGFVGMRDAQREAVRAPGSIFRKEKDKMKSTGLRVIFAPVEPAVNKGKGVVVISLDVDDGWGDDEVLSGWRMWFCSAAPCRLVRPKTTVVPVDTVRWLCRASRSDAAKAALDLARIAAPDRLAWQSYSA
ncbi:hypothetical protein HU200_040697 [Digitaria exilis]|uniref:Uncharacterized protein n=1 Tax=Digitaria exilis TaxID=1010633 RepID=A0A835B936_9POAL|nr:hypothetical protein HU200_040697 [Digitaria exilis]